MNVGLTLSLSTHATQGQGFGAGWQNEPVWLLASCPTSLHFRFPPTGSDPSRVLFKPFLRVFQRLLVSALAHRQYTTKGDANMPLSGGWPDFGGPIDPRDNARICLWLDTLAAAEGRGGPPPPPAQPHYPTRGPARLLAGAPGG